MSGNQRTLNPGTWHADMHSVGYPQVRETQKTIRDGRTGTESMTIARGMGEQASDRSSAV
jgi:hypothetical protein